MSRDTQKEAFLKGEADRYFERNRTTLEDLEGFSPGAALFARHVRSGDRVAEVGCANGRTLELLRRKTGCRAHGVDPSEAAIAAGRKAYPELDLACGSADRLPWANASMDVVILGFFLYLVDRTLLHACVAEADRVLADGGLLTITDFDPPEPRVRAYRHSPGVNSYKMDYSLLFLADPAYTVVEKVEYSHAGLGRAKDPAERLASWVLKKDLAKAYIREEDA